MFVWNQKKEPKGIKCQESHHFFINSARIDQTYKNSGS